MAAPPPPPSPVGPAPPLKILRKADSLAQLAASAGLQPSAAEALQGLFPDLAPAVLVRGWGGGGQAGALVIR